MNLPEGWARILEAQDPWPEALRMWSPFRARMGRTILAMSSRLRRVALHALEDGTPTLRYFFQRGGTTLCYQGNPPGPPPPHVPADVAEFYERLHGGWATPLGRSEGLLPASECYRLDGLLAVSDLLGGVCALGFDVRTGVCWKWWKDLPPEMVIDFWGTFDRDVAKYVEQQDRVR